MLAWAHPCHGRLLTPRHHSSAAATAAAGIPWAVDNDGFGGVDLEAFERMVERLGELVYLGFHRCRRRRLRRPTAGAYNRPQWRGTFR